MAIIEQKKKNLYIQDIFDVNSTNPSSLHIGIPQVDMEGVRLDMKWITGLLASEPTISTSNKWGPILNDVSMLSFYAALTDMRSIPSWIGASAQCWKGTDPIRINLDFYLINYSENLNLEEGLRALTKLTSLAVDPKSFTSVFVHGGYKVNALSNNASRFNNTMANYKKNGQPSSEDSDFNAIGEFRNSGLSGMWDQLINRFNGISSGSDGEGTVIIRIGNKLTLDKLLVAAINVTPSVVEVCKGDADVSSPKPLYYHVTMALHGCRPLITEDVDKMYNG